jgi:decaprenylphospho-beta-D-erythro-pentofuranosid-2-ulose 2-reductase
VRAGSATGAGGLSAGRRVLVLGGSSEIALAIVGELQARAPREVALLGRDRARLEQAAAQLRTAGCERAIAGELDALDTDGHEQALADALERLGGADIAILAVGVLGEGGGLARDVGEALDVLRVNLVGCASLLLHLAARLREQGGGALVVLSSAAAERPRRSNAVYGASKAGLDALAQAIGDELRPDRVRVLVARPGFVHTRMTRGLRPAPLATTPAVVARAVVDGLERGAHTVWAPRSLRWVMWAVRLIPRPLFRRMKL